MLERSAHALAQVVAGLRDAWQHWSKLADLARSLDWREEQHSVDIPHGRNRLDGVSQQRAAKRSKAVL